MSWQHVQWNARQTNDWHGNVKQPWIAYHVQKHVSRSIHHEWWLKHSDQKGANLLRCQLWSISTLVAGAICSLGLWGLQSSTALGAPCCEACWWLCWTPSATWTSSMRRRWQRTLSPKVVAFLDMVVSPRSWASTAGGWELGWLVRRCYLKMNKRNWAP